MHELLHQVPIESDARCVEARMRDIDKAERAGLVLGSVVLNLPRTQVAGSVKVHRDRLRRHDAWMSWPSIVRQPLEQRLDRGDSAAEAPVFGFHSEWKWTPSPLSCFHRRWIAFPQQIA